jgi:ribosomal protein L13
MAEIKSLSKSDFNPHLNTKFEIHTDALGVVEAELVEITGEKYENQESFSLIFSTPKDKVFEQKIYKIKHPQMGEMDLFMVPIASSQKDEMHYQVVFSRLLEK